MVYHKSIWIANVHDAINFSNRSLYIRVRKQSWQRYKHSGRHILRIIFKTKRCIKKMNTTQVGYLISGHNTDLKRFNLFHILRTKSTNVDIDIEVCRVVEFIPKFVGDRCFRGVYCLRKARGPSSSVTWTASVHLQGRPILITALLFRLQNKILTTARNNIVPFACILPTFCNACFNDRVTEGRIMPLTGETLTLGSWVWSHPGHLIVRFHHRLYNVLSIMTQHGGWASPPCRHLFGV